MVFSVSNLWMEWNFFAGNFIGFSDMGKGCQIKLLKKLLWNCFYRKFVLLLCREKFWRDIYLRKEKWYYECD